MWWNISSWTEFATDTNGEDGWTWDFTYPNGMWDQRTENMVKRVYDMARHFHCYGRAGYITRQTDPYRLPTMNINYSLPFDQFQMLVTGSNPDHRYYPEAQNFDGPELAHIHCGG